MFNLNKSIADFGDLIRSINAGERKNVNLTKHVSNMIVAAHNDGARTLLNKLLDERDDIPQAMRDDMVNLLIELTDV